MTTPLRNTLARELVLDDVPFKVVISPEGVRIMRKGRRKGRVISWETILRLSDADQEKRVAPSTAATDLPDAMAAELADDISAAQAALTKAGKKLATAKNLPPELRLQLEPDPVYGAQEEQRPDWFIEPLLTSAELASVLRISTAAVTRLPIRSMVIAGERPYRQSEVRQYIAREERESVYGRW